LSDTDDEIKCVPSLGSDRKPLRRLKQTNTRASEIRT